MLEPHIYIVFATAEPQIANRLCRSIKKHLPNLSVNIAALHIGFNSDTSTVKLSKNITLIARHQTFLPIVESRNHCQTFLQQQMTKSSDIGLILDDDLLWTMPEKHFLALIKQLKQHHCDMAFSSLAGDPPIPKEYTRASPLLDILLSIVNDNQQNPLIDIRTFISTINCNSTYIENTRLNHRHHDYYAFDKNNFYPQTVLISTMQWTDFLSRLNKGQMTTRPVIVPKQIEPATGRERGGATLILNPLVLNYKNTAIKLDKWTSRRSDMMMATAVEQAGYKLYSTPPILFHKREDNFDSHQPKKLIEDMLGVALVNSRLNNKSLTFEQAFIKRLSKSRFIIEQTNDMLGLLSNWLVEKKLSNQAIIKLVSNMVYENNAIISGEFKEILTLRNQLIGRENV
jgi:hypothetical protein